MKILVSWKKPSSDFEIETIVSGLESEHEIVYWIGYKKQRDKVKENSKAIFHDIDLARLNKKSLEFTKPIPPIDAEIIKSLFKNESIALSMMNRKFASLSLDEKKHLYYDLLSYWNTVLQTYKPEAIVFNCLPHALFNYCLYALAEYYNLNILTFIDTWETDRMISLDKIDGSSFFDNLVLSGQDKNYSLDEISPDFRNYYETQINPNKDATPNYIKKQVKDQKKSNSLLNKIKNKTRALAYVLGGQGRIKQLIISKFKKHPKKYLIKEYRKYQQNPNLKEKYVYFGLHFQPERTTCPQGEMYNDQVLAIETLSFALPEDWKIYVKEHPMQWWLRGSNDPNRFSGVRYKGYYEKINRLKNVVLVPPEFSTFELIENAKVVATITGTVGWESIMRQKPVMIFGSAWYQNFPKIFKISGPDSAKEAFSEIQNGFEVKKQEVVDYLNQADKAIFYGFIDEFGEKNSVLDNRENAKKITNIILENLENAK